MKQIQIKLTVQIHRINLVVKFPCSISASLKTDSEEIAVGQEVPLSINEAVLQQSASLTFSLFYDSIKEVFSDKKIEIGIYIRSSNNKIPSGFVSININSLKEQQGRRKFSLEKCPDKNACVEATITYTILSEVNFQTEAELIKVESSSQQFGTSRSGVLRPAKTKYLSKKELRSEQKSAHFSGDNNTNDSQIQQSSPQRRMDRQKSESETQKKSVKKSNFKREEHYRDRGETERNITESEVNYRNNENDREYKGLLRKYDLQNAQLKAVINRRDVLQKSLKESESQFKIYKQKYQNLFVQHQNYVKKVQFKQNLNKDQITTLNEKLMLSESQKQKMLFQKNNLVDSFEERERNLRLGFKEKEKVFADEKNRLTKRVESMIKQSTDQQAFSSEMQSKVSQLTIEWEAAKFKNNQLEIKILQLNEEISNLNNQIVEQKSKQMQLQQKWSSSLDLEDDKKKLRKRIAEKQQQNIKQANTITLLQATSLKYQKKCQQAQVLLKEKVSALKINQKQLENSVKQADNLKRNLEESQKKIEDLTILKQNQAIKSEGLNLQIRELSRKNQQDMRNVGYESKEKETSIKKLNDQLNSTNLALMAASKKNEQLDLQLSQLRKNIKKVEMQNETLLNTTNEMEDNNSKLVSSLEQQKNSRQSMQKDYKAQLSIKDNMILDFEQKMTKFTSQMSSKQQQNYYRITDLQKKLIDFEKENASLLQELKNTKNSLDELKIEKMKNNSSNEDLQYTIKLKNNQIHFLKESVEKCNQQIRESNTQIKELNIQIERLTQNVESLQQEQQNLQHVLEEANFSGSQTEQRLEAYKAKNKQALQNYFKSIKGGLIEVNPQHEEQDVKRWMLEAINNHNQFVNQKEEHILQLTAQLNGTNSQLEETLAHLENVKASLQKQKIKNSQTSEQAEETQKHMELQLQTMYNTNQKLDEQLSMLKDQKASLSEEIQSLNTNLKQKLKDITLLKTQIENLNENLKQQEQDYTNYNSQTSSQYQQQIAQLQSNISGLNSNLAAQTKKTQQISNKLNDVSKQYKDYQKKNEQQTRIQLIDNDKLNKQLQQNRRQLENKLNAITKYEQVTQTLKANLQKANKQNLSLKEVSENIRKRNQKGASRQKQLENIIESLKKNQINLTQKQLEQEKTIKDKLNELVTCRENNLRLDREKVKIKQQYDTLRSELKEKDDLLTQNDKAIKSVQAQIIILNAKFKTSEKGSSDKENGLNKEITLLKGNKLKLQEQLAQLKERYSKQNKQFTQQIKQLKGKNVEFDTKIKALSKSMEEQTKIHDLQNQYLTPIRDNTSVLNQQLVGCIQVCDDFESNKNKLLKIANNKTWQFDDKFTSERVRDINLAYQKLKLNIMGNQNLTKAQYDGLISEIKKVQAAIDRVLKGDR